MKSRWIISEMSLPEKTLDAVDLVFGEEWVEWLRKMNDAETNSSSYVITTVVFARLNKDTDNIEMGFSQ